MALLGLSILVVSISFLCYRNHSFYRPWLEWLKRRPSVTSADEGKKIQEAEKDIKHKDGKTSTREAQDRRAMPPPPPPSLRKSSTPSSPTTPRATASFPTTSPSSMPAFKLDDSPPAPSFPALNSAQRASGGTRAPPRLNPVVPASSLMPPPSRSPLPNRLPQPSSSSSFSLAPPPTHTSIPSKPSRKVLLTPGHSPLDWARLSSSSSTNLSGLPPNTPYLKVPPSLLRKHTGRKGKDAWTVLGGKVYNITPYAPFHPGGEPELLRAAGRDGSRLFGEVHPWVNWEGMLEGCLVGIAVEEGDVKVGGSALEDMD